MSAETALFLVGIAFAVYGYACTSFGIWLAWKIAGRARERRAHSGLTDCSAAAQDYIRRYGVLTAADRKHLRSHPVDLMKGLRRQ